MTEEIKTTDTVLAERPNEHTDKTRRNFSIFWLIILILGGVWGHKSNLIYPDITCEGFKEVLEYYLTNNGYEQIKSTDFKETKRSDSMGFIECNTNVSFIYKNEPATSLLFHFRVKKDVDHSGVFSVYGTVDSIYPLGL